MPPEQANLWRGEFQRKHLAAPLLQEFMQTHCILDPYKIEIYKGCWHQKLCCLKAANFGELPECEVEQLYSEFQCKFGCPPPKTPASVFVGMHEVPRPSKASGMAKYQSFEDTYGKSTPLDLPPLKPGAAQESAPPGVLDKDKVQGTIACTSCGRLRCVYVKMKLSAVTRGAPSGCTLKDVLSQALDANSGSYTCGADLDLQGFEALQGLFRPYVRLKLDCSQHIELQLYSSAILPRAVSAKICGYCGEEGAYQEGNDEAVPLLPVCQPCFDQHKKARPTGRQVGRFDRSGMRQRHGEASRAREENVQSARDQAQQMNPPPPKRARQESSATASGSSSSEPTHEEPTDVRTTNHNEETIDEAVEDDDNESEEEDEGAGEADYLVKKIHKVRLMKRRMEYLIEWEGYPAEEHYTWEPSAHLYQCHGHGQGVQGGLDCQW